MDGAGERQKEKERDNNVRWPFKWRKGSLNGGGGAVGSYRLLMMKYYETIIFSGFDPGDRIIAGLRESSAGYFSKLTYPSPPAP
jgi:hypothetical protein